MFLLDTNVVSELRKAKSGKANPRVVAWAASVPSTRLYLSVITLMELEMGVLLIERRDPKGGSALRTWLEGQVIPAFTDRILAIDLPVARRWARLHVPDPRSERDAPIGATALVHGFTVVTRNVADFVHLGVAVLDPWEVRGETRVGVSPSS